MSIYSLALTNIDHYVAVTEPAHYLQQFGNHKSACWVIFIWTIGLAFTIPIAIMGPQKVIIYMVLPIKTIFLSIIILLKF